MAQNRRNSVRIIARLDIKNNFLIKPIQLDGLRKLGDPNEFALKYYNEGIDEIIFLDNVASLYKRQYIDEIILKATSKIFVPITVGGGIKSVKDVDKILRLGADKISINTAAVNKPELITEISKEFGSQCMVVSIEAKKNDSSWEVYTNNGRERTHKNVIEWVKECNELGAGELLITSIDKDGTKKGFDKNLILNVKKNSSIPIIASGGAGNSLDCLNMLKETNVSSFAIGSLFHYNLLTIQDLKSELSNNNFNIR